MPAALAHGSELPDDTSPWWQQRRLLELVEQDFTRWTLIVRNRWDPFEATLVAEATTVEAEVCSAIQAGRREDGASLLTAFMDRTVQTYRVELASLIQEISELQQR